MDRATRKCGTRLIQPLVSLGAEQVRKSIKFLSPVPSFEETVPEGHGGHEAQHTSQPHLLKGCGTLQANRLEIFVLTNVV
jgi:hypothetical protein